MTAVQRHRPQEAKDKVFRQRKQSPTLAHASDDANFAVIKPLDCDRGFLEFSFITALNFTCKKLLLRNFLIIFDIEFKTDLSLYIMTEIEIKPNDLISGSTYLKFIHDYKAYDRRQKEIIAKLQNKIEFLEWEVEDLRLALEDSDGPSYTKLQTKLRNQRANLISYSSRIAQLKKDNEALIMENVSLTQQINDLKQHIRNLAGGLMASHLSDMVD